MASCNAASTRETGLPPACSPAVSNLTSKKIRMKKTLYYIFALLVLASCKKDFKLQDNMAITTQSFWKTAADASEGVNAIYSTYHRDALARNHYFVTMLRSDEGYSTSPNTDIINTFDV